MQMQLAGTMRDTEYGQFRDAVSDKQYQDAFAIQQAEGRAQYGDFGGYADIYGDEAAKDMALAWAAANPDAAFAAGTITADEYYTLTGKKPHVRGRGAGNGTTLQSVLYGQYGQLVTPDASGSVSPERAAIAANTLLAGNRA